VTDAAARSVPAAAAAPPVVAPALAVAATLAGAAVPAVAAGRQRDSDAVPDPAAAGAALGPLAGQHGRPGSTGTPASQGTHSAEPVSDPADRLAREEAASRRVAAPDSPVAGAPPPVLFGKGMMAGRVRIAQRHPRNARFAPTARGDPRPHGPIDDRRHRGPINDRRRPPSMAETPHRLGCAGVDRRGAPSRHQGGPPGRRLAPPDHPTARPDRPWSSARTRS
jgi:hypothetical protein